MDLVESSTKSFLILQIHPVVSRLCAPIEGTDSGHLADCLGLDANKVHVKPLIPLIPLIPLLTFDNNYLFIIFKICIDEDLSVNLIHRCLKFFAERINSIVVLQFLRRETSSTIDRDSARLTSASMLDDDDRYMPNALSLIRVCLHILLMFFFFEVISKSFFRLKSLFCSLRVPLCISWMTGTKTASHWNWYVPNATRGMHLQELLTF